MSSDDPRHIAITHIGKWISDSAGGIERVIAECCVALAPDALVTRIGAFHGSGSWVSESKGYREVGVGAVATIFSTPVAPRMPAILAREHARNRSGIVHLHMPDPMSHLATSSAVPHAPLVLSWHADVISRRFLGGFYSPLLRQLCERADAIIVATAAHVSGSHILERPGIAAKCEIIPYGISERRLGKAPACVEVPMPFAESAAPTVLAVGRLVWYKGFDVLLRALAKVQGLNLILVGGGPEQASLEGLVAELQLRSRVYLAGPVDDEVLAAYYQSADFFCLPSRTAAEAFGIVQLEAMAAGLPIISTRLGTGVELVNIDGLTGMVIAPEDAETLADALSTMARDEIGRARLGRQAREHFLALYSAKTMGKRLLSVYARLR